MIRQQQSRSWQKIKFSPKFCARKFQHWRYGWFVTETLNWLLSVRNVKLDILNPSVWHLISCTKPLSFAKSQDKLAQITAEIASKNFVLSSALEVAKEMRERIIANNSKKSGLCIRCLNKKNLQGVLDFLGPQSSAIVVCKYWRLCLKQWFVLLLWTIFGNLENVLKSEYKINIHIDYVDLVYCNTKMTRSVAALQEKSQTSVRNLEKHRSMSVKSWIFQPPIAVRT